jgi:dynein heavy chain, axonemal
MQVRSINKMIRDEDCYKGLDSTVKSFTASLPLVGELRSPAMRARHWDALMAATKKKIALDDPGFSLQQLLGLQVFPLFLLIPLGYFPLRNMPCTCCCGGTVHI